MLLTSLRPHQPTSQSAIIRTLLSVSQLNPAAVKAVTLVTASLWYFQGMPAATDTVTDSIQRGWIDNGILYADAIKYSDNIIKFNMATY